MTDFFSLLDTLNSEEQTVEMLDNLTVLGQVWIGVGNEDSVILHAASITVDPFCNIFIVPYGYKRCKTDKELIDLVAGWAERAFTSTFFVVIDVQGIWLKNNLSEIFSSFIYLHGAIHLHLLERTTPIEREEIIEICNLKRQIQKQEES